MAATCPRCGSDILPGEVSVGPAPERLEVARCLCCGSQLERAAGEEKWALPAEP